MNFFKKALAALQISGLLLLRRSLTLAAIVNRTIDDTDGDSQTRLRPVYLPTTEGVWKDQSCRDCAINPDVAQAFKRTYTAATYSPASGKISVTLEFNGTAIWVYFILANNAGDGITTVTDCNFIMDDEDPVPYRHAPDLTSEDYLYNQLVYSRSDLPFDTHTLEIAVESNFNSYVNFDYAIYTHDDDPSTIVPPTETSTTPNPTGSSATNVPSNTDLPAGSNPGQSGTSSSPPTGAIAGGVAGGIVAIIAALLVLFLCRKRRRERMQASNHGPPVLMDEIDHSTYSARPETGFVQENAYHRGPDSTGTNLFQGGAQGTLYSPLPDPERQSGHPTSYTSGSQYSTSAYGGIARSQAGDSDPATTVAGSSSAGVFSSGAALYGGSARTEKQRLRENMERNDALHSANSGGVPAAYSASSTGAFRLSNLTDADEQERIRQERQEEIGQRLRSVQNEMDELGRDLKRGKSRKRPGAGGGSGSRPGVSTAEVDELSEMREQMRQMQQEIEFLRENQASEWAQGLSNEPPPGYTPAAEVHGVRPLSIQRRS